MSFQVENELPRVRAASVRGEAVDWEGAKRALIANEGKWVLIAEDVHLSTGDQLRRGKYSQFPETEVANFEFAARRPENSTYLPRRTDIWGCYTAPKKKGRR